MEGTSDYYEERGLIAAIIIQAIQDGSLMKRPRDPSLRNKIRDRLAVVQQLTTFFVSCHLLQEWIKSKKKKKRIPYYIYEIICNIEIMKIGERENLAWNGRKFIDHTNKLFSFYCSLLEIEPKFLEEKIHLHFKKIDAGTGKRLSLVY
jgi:hypothetical protein